MLVDQYGHDKPIDELQTYEYSLLSAAEGLHMAVTGAGDPGPRGEPTAVANLLKRRLADWRNPEGCSPYDNAVKALCEAALAEWEGSWLQKSEETGRCNPK